MSKRTLIITGIAVLMVLAAVFSIYLEKRELQNIYESSPDEIEIDEDEAEEKAEQKPEETTFKRPGRPKKEQSGGVTIAEEKTAKDVENETGTATE